MKKLVLSSIALVTLFAFSASTNAPESNVNHTTTRQLAYNAADTGGQTGLLVVKPPREIR